jgi:hypothetical protein
MHAFLRVSPPYLDSAGLGKQGRRSRPDRKMIARLCSTNPESFRRFWGGGVWSGTFPMDTPFEKKLTTVWLWDSVANYRTVWNWTGSETTVDRRDARNFIEFTACPLDRYADKLKRGSLEHALNNVSTSICILASNACEKDTRCADGIWKSFVVRIW